MSHRWRLVALLTLAPLAASAQAREAFSSPKDSLVLAHDFTARGEFARVELEQGKVYRVEVTNARVLAVRNREAGTQLPFTRITEDLARPSNTVAFELEPSVSGEYELRLDGRTRGLAQMRVFLDAHATQRQQKVIRS